MLKVVSNCSHASVLRTMYLLWDGAMLMRHCDACTSLLLVGVMAMSVLNRSILILHGRE